MDIEEGMCYDERGKKKTTREPTHPSLLGIFRISESRKPISPKQTGTTGYPTEETFKELCSFVVSRSKLGKE